MMKYNDKKYKYPARYDLEQVLGFISKRSFVDNLAKKRGVFFSKTLREDLGGLLSLFFYDHQDLVEIQESAYRSNESQSYSGFIVHIDGDNQDPVSLLQNLRDNGTLGSDMDMSVLSRAEEDGKQVFTGSFDYVKKKPGKIELLQEENRSFDFKIKKNSENEFEVFIDGKNASDTGEFKKILKKNSTGYRFDDLDQAKLNATQTIEFFDRLAEEGMENRWQLSEVRQLVLRSDINEEEMVISDNDTLTGIKQAVLDGQNLRENSFVKQTESRGYRFTSMTYRFRNSEIPTVIDIKAEFKLRPKVFMVDINGYYVVEMDRTEELEVEDKLEYREEIFIKNRFLKKARNVYKSILSLE